MDTTGLPTTRKEAQKKGAAYYYTGQPCKYGHVAPRKTKGACVECIREEWQISATKRAQYFADYNKSEAGLAAKQRYYAANRAAVIARAQARPEADKRTYRANYYERNPGWKKTDTSFRRKRHKLATPKWLTRKDKLAIKALYQKAMEMTRITGVACVVDHEIPLRGTDVCGLHVPWNLKIMTSTANLAKSNILPNPDSDSPILVIKPSGATTTYPNVLAITVVLPITAPEIIESLSSGDPLAKGLYTGWKFVYA